MVAATFPPPTRYRPVCDYCRTDPVKAVCVNCGAPQPEQECLEWIEVTTLDDPKRRFLTWPSESTVHGRHIRP